jgi:hypothetical protein
MVILLLIESRATDLSDSLSVDLPPRCSTRVMVMAASRTACSLMMKDQSSSFSRARENPDGSPSVASMRWTKR